MYPEAPRTYPERLRIYPQALRMYPEASRIDPEDVRTNPRRLRMYPQRPLPDPQPSLRHLPPFRERPGAPLQLRGAVESVLTTEVGMTRLLERAFAEVSKLPEEAQDRVAAHLLEELADEAKWDAAFAASADRLEKLAAEAVEEYRAGGRTEELGFDQL